MSSETMNKLPDEVKQMLEKMPADKREMMLKQISGMKPEQMKMMLQKMKQMSPEEREAMRQKRASMSPEELAELSKSEEKQRMMQQKMAQMQSGGNKKAANFSGSLKRLLSYVLRKKFSLFLVVVASVIATIFSVATPMILAKALDHFQQHVMDGSPFNYRRVTVLVCTMGVMYLITYIFSLIQGSTMVTITHETLYQMRKDVDKKLMKLPFQYFDSKQKGDILSRITNDIDNIGTCLQQSLTQIITSILTISGCLILMFTISWQITLICLVCLALGVTVSKKLMNISQGYFRKQWQNLGDLNGLVEEAFSGMYVVKAFGCEERKIEEFIKSNEGLYEVSRQAQFRSGIVNPFSQLFNNLAYICICVLGAFSFIAGRLSLGNISALIQYQKQYSNPVTQLANVLNTLQSAIASAERVFELLDEEEEKETSGYYHKLDEVSGAVDFAHLKFGYTPGKILMKDIDVHVEPGQMVAIVGPTGAGKTTLVNLLMRFYEPNSGAIKIDGMDIKEMTRHDLRDIFGMVLQDTWLYSGTIYENIAYGNENAEREQVIAAAKSAQIEFFFETMPDGYETMLNEDATNISQGQKQLMTIARAMVADPKILILDEATSSVDTRTELMIQKAMNNLLKGRTSFVIAHRLSTIRDADLILYMENGNILEQGTHSSLMEKGGKYAELYNSQFAHEEEKFHGLIYYDGQTGQSPRWKEILETFGKERGIPVRYTCGNDRIYEEGLARAMAGDNPPALVKTHHGMIQKLTFLHDIFEPLDDTRAAGELVNFSNVMISHDGKIIGMPYYADCIALIYNKRLIQKYFDLPDRAHIVESVDELQNQDQLIAFVKDIWDHKEEIGVEGVFPTCSFEKGGAVQWKSFVMSLPMYYELKEKNTRTPETFDFKYRDQTKKLFDMFFKYCAGTPEDFAGTTIADSVRAFATGKVPMIFYIDAVRQTYVNRNRLTTPEQLKDVIGEEDIGAIAPFFGKVGEKEENIAIGIAWTHSVYKYADEEQKRYAKEFIDWIAFSDTGKRMMRDMHYVLPYKGITEKDLPQSSLKHFIHERMIDESREQIPFIHSLMPSGEFRETYAADLLAYAKGEVSWEEISQKLSDSWNAGFKRNTANMKRIFADVLNQ